jgi:hypothetical protein
VGAGDLRSATVPFDCGCRKLLRTVFGSGSVGGPGEAGSDLPATQRALADSVDRSLEAGAEVEPATGGSLPSGTQRRRRSQLGDLGSGTEAGGVSFGGRPIGQTVRGPHPATGSLRGGRKSGITTRSKLTSGKITGTRQCLAPQRLISDPPAVPRVCGTVRRRVTFRCAINVSRPAGLPQFNLRGRRSAVPANGCLVPLMP